MKTATAKKPAPVPKSALELLAPKDIIALMLWQNRFAKPDLATVITEKDMEGLKACLKYLKVEPEVNIVRKKGAVIVTLIQKGSINADEKSPGFNPSGNGIVPVENNEEDFERAMKVQTVERARSKASTLGQELLNGIGTGTYSEGIMREAAEVLQTLSQA